MTQDQINHFRATEEKLAEIQSLHDKFEASFREMRGLCDHLMPDGKTATDDIRGSTYCSICCSVVMGVAK